MVLLSICIATYNREKFLMEGLENICQQIEENKYLSIVEVVISDNASEDRTEECVKSFMEKTKVHIVYEKQKKNLGFDRNIYHAVSLASGKFCWLMGDDDYLCENAISDVIKEIETNDTIYLFNRYECYQNSHKVRNARKWLIDSIESDTTFLFDSDEKATHFFASCESMGGAFGFISSLIIKRKEWNSIQLEEKYFNSLFIHVFICCSLLKTKEATVRYIVTPKVLCNVSQTFGDITNYIERTLLDLNGFFCVSECFDEMPIVKKEFLSVIRKDHPTININRLKDYSKQDRERLFEAFQRVGYSKAEMDVFREICNAQMELKLYYLKKRIMNKLKSCKSNRKRG